MDDSSLPYRAEYAKSGRSSCRLCKNAIAKDDLRLAVMVQSRAFDGKEAKWHHFSCFFGRCRPKDAAEIEHFQSLRWEDQEKIKKNIEINGSGGGGSSAGCAANASKRKSKQKDTPSNVPNFNDFKIEYAKSGKSKCKHCEEYIGKSEVRISKKDFNSEAAKMYGPHERWHHVDCFLKVREELDFLCSGTALPGYKSLSPDDQNLIKKKIQETKREDDMVDASPNKKMKADIPDDLKDEMKKQNNIMFKYRDQLEGLKKSELVCLLEYNNQEVPEGLSRILERLADCMTFGALKKCSKCNGQLNFQSGVGYKCKGHISEWVRCDHKTSKPSRVTFKVPKELQQDYDFLKKYKGKVIDRIFVETPSAVKEEKKELVKIKSSSPPPLQLLEFFIHKSTNNVKSLIKSLGGKVVPKFSETITAVVSTEEEANKGKLAKVLISAKNADIPVLSADFFKEITNSTSRDEIVQKWKDKTVSSWGSDIEKRMPSMKELIPKKSSHREKSMFKSGESVKKVTLKDGLAVDPDSELEKVSHVYRRRNDIYSTVLSLTDVQENINSYYKLQVLESDEKNKYWLFRAWGRIGTTIGGNRVDKYKKIDDCVEEFKRLFEDKTGNVWEMRDNFKKVPGKMMMLEVSYKEDHKKGKEIMKPKLEISSSTLHKAVQDLITLIFDIEAMEKTMMEFELDLEKMPLGKISRHQIQTAYGILSELQEFVKSKSEKHLITERTNRFYTLVPHDCGIRSPPLLNSEDIIRDKIEVLNSLMEIEIAYNLLQECNGTGNTVDDHYKKLNASIIVVERDSDEFKIIETYVKNSHAKTHMNYKLEIEEIFKIDKDGEEKRYKKFKKLSNRMLLWHGSRLTNFVGILSQGLRKAPPEAPSTGYMFGKGIYFADRVSKSANYCMTSKKNPTGLILLCEVALGQMYELTQAKYVQKLPPGKHSVKGVGKNMPDPKEKAVAPTGAEIPLGPTVDAGNKDTSLLYNEYIVYDVSQVKMQYLLRLKFKYNV